MEEETRASSGRIITPCDVGNCTFCIGVQCEHICHDEPPRRPTVTPFRR